MYDYFCVVAAVAATCELVQYLRFVCLFLLFVWFGFVPRRLLVR